MKQSSLPISVVSPVYNNGRTLLDVITSIESLLSAYTTSYEIVLIDDGSTDESIHILHSLEKKKHIRILYHQTNKGIAYTYRHLYSVAKHEHIVLFSVDGEWNPQDIIRLLKEAKKTNADIVIGKRTKKAYSVTRLAVSSLYNSLTVLLFGVLTHDAGSIKYIRKSVIEHISIISYGVFDEAERIIKATKQGYTVCVLPVSHRGTKKTRTLAINIPLVIQAIVDLLRVWIHVRFH